MSIQNYINHVVFVLDASSSMRDLASTVVKVFDNQIKYLAERSVHFQQETRVSVYVFADDVNCLIYDMDVMRLPSLAAHYRADGMTALIDSVMKAADDLGQTPQLYGDHAFLVYVLTDGGENRSRHQPRDLSKMILASKANWTFACLVPDVQGIVAAKQCGFPADNVQVWDASSRAGLEKAGEVIRASTEAFMSGRSKGVRGTTQLFKLQAQALNLKVVKQKLDELSPTDYDLFPVHKEAVIQPFVESWTQKPYRKGSAYYQLSKPEKIQNHKQVVVQNKVNGKLYSGTGARTLLGLPDYEVKVSPADHDKFDIFVQSTSANRKLVAGTKLVVLK